MGAFIRGLGSALLVGALTVGLAGAPASATPPDKVGHADLKAAMAELARSGAAGVQVRLHDEHGNWTGSAGVRELRGGTVPTNGRFRVGSITKTFVATVLLQLVDEGALALDDPAAGYLPEYGLDQRITVRMLLQHTSGLFNYTGEPRPDGTVEPGIPLYGKEFVKNQYHMYAPEELVGVALSKPARFEPGTSWSYSNTNYILAGQLIERLTGTSYAKQVRQRILRPLGLRETTLPGASPWLPNPHANGYYTFRDKGKLKVVDVSTVNPTWAGAAGEIISTTRDLDTFLDALLDGELLPAGLLAEMRDALPLGPTDGYGLGLQTLDAGDQCGGVYEGHTGGMHGYQSFLFSNGDKQFTMSLTVGDADLEDPATAERLAVALNNVLVAALCDGAQARTPMLVPQMAA